MPLYHVAIQQPEQNGCHFADIIFNCIFLNESHCILVKFFTEFYSWEFSWQLVSIASVNGLAPNRHQALSEPMMTQFTSFFFFFLHLDSKVSYCCLWKFILYMNNLILKKWWKLISNFIFKINFHRNGWYENIRNVAPCISFVALCQPIQNLIPCSHCCFLPTLSAWMCYSHPYLPGPYFNMKTVFPGIGIPIIKIRCNLSWSQTKQFS